MIRAIAVRPAGDWHQDAADTIVLGFDDRHRRRVAMTATRGLAFLLDLAEATALRGGDALVLEDGRLVEVIAAPEPLLEIRGVGARELTRLAWHVGNRHLAAQIGEKWIRIRRDHVIADMVKGLGGRVIEIEAPFDPESGAYAGAGATHAHGHHDDGKHDHAHHDHAHHDRAHHGHGHHDHRQHEHVHAHGEGCHGPHDHHGHHGHHHGYDEIAGPERKLPHDAKS